MKPSPDPNRRRPQIRTALLVVAVVALGAVALGCGDVVRAALDPPPPLQPYDPLVRW